MYWNFKVNHSLSVIDNSTLLKIDVISQSFFGRLGRSRSNRDVLLRRWPPLMPKARLFLDSKIGDDKNYKGHGR